MARESMATAEYIRQHPKVTDLLVTGGDPMAMKAPVLAQYLEPFLKQELKHLRTIRIGSKSLSYWPYRYLSDDDADDVLRFSRKLWPLAKRYLLWRISTIPWSFPPLPFNRLLAESRVPEP